LKVEQAVKIYLSYLKDNTRPNTVRSFSHTLNKFKASFAGKEMEQRRPKPTQQLSAPDAKLERCFQARREMEDFSQAMSQLHEQARRVPATTRNRRNT